MTAENGFRPRITARRNPGPGWGTRFLLWADRWWPAWLFRAGLMAGTWVAVACMPRQRAHSREYLAAVHQRPARLGEIWRHFLAFAESLMTNLRAGRGLALRCVIEPENAGAFESLVQSGEPALFGTFHVGASDLLGYFLGERQQRVAILRLSVGNSEDTRLLGQRFGENVSFLWVNDPSTMLFDLKAALEAGQSVAMKCDRLEFSSRTLPVRFLGAERLFPFTLYHLSVLFGRPAIFCTAVEDVRAGELRIQSSPVFRPDPAASRDDNLAAAGRHFQDVITHLESLVRQRPELWFNFLPLNPVAHPPSS